jgi:hypothetical protein
LGAPPRGNHSQAAVRAREIVRLTPRTGSSPSPNCAGPLAAGSNLFEIIGRSERIRTSDPIVPNDVRYQAALHSDIAA